MSIFLLPLILFPAPIATPSLQAPVATSIIGQTDEIQELVTRGRRLIAEGLAEEACAVLQEADAKDGGDPRTRMWLVRALIERNYLNDALDMTDELASGGTTGPDLDYLYGMAFVYKAKKYLSEGVNLGMVGMHFGDAVGYLKSATKADATKYGDAFLPLAEAAWNSQQLDVARAAAESAAARAGSGAAEAFMLGEVAFSQFVVAGADEARQEEADAHWQVAHDAFRKACALEGKPSEPLPRNRLARSHRKVADALVWKARPEEAAAEYALAMGWDPTTIDFGQLLSSLGKESFLSAMEAGAKNFTRRHGKKDPTDATLVWWLGWARFDAKEYESAKDAFSISYEKWPGYVNCLWYIGLCEYHSQDYAAAIESILENFNLDPGGLAASINSNGAFNQRIVEYLVGVCVRESNVGDADGNRARSGIKRLVDAAVLSEVQATASPETSRFWNNVGLFYRDAADSLRDRRSEADQELRASYNERALKGYEAALALEPENPALLNDTAVVLHYNLDRDLDRAKRMYRRSHERAVEELARTDLTADLRSLYEIALRDSRNNLQRLEALLERRELERREREKARREKEEGAGEVSGA